MEDQSKEQQEGLADVLRKLAYLGAGTIFYTQEGMQRMISENMRMPKDAAGAIATQLERGRKELVESLTRTVANALHNVDVVDAARRGLDGLELDVKVKLSYPTSTDSGKRSPAQKPARKSSRKTAAKKA